MKKIKILSVFGTRPEAIKMAPVIWELKRRQKQFSSKICVTAQHREMLHQVLEIFQLKPDVDLDIMTKNQSISRVTAAIFNNLEPLLLREKPDWMLVQGDTTTTAAAALCAFYNGIRVGHIEAGLRSYNRQYPFPEEINRKVASVSADLHFAPTETARNNLLAEGIDATTVVVTGNPVIDAVHWAVQQPPSKSLQDLLVKNRQRRIILVTAHRRENHGKPLLEICRAIRNIAESNNDIIIFFPVHPNPNVKHVVRQELSGQSNIELLQPQNYLDFMHLLKNCYLVLSDSGGIQEEAPGFGRPVLLLRDVTERPEAVAAGTVKLTGCSADNIIAECQELLTDANAYEKMTRAVNPFGDGQAAQKIVEALLAFSTKQK